MDRFCVEIPYFNMENGQNAQNDRFCFRMISHKRTDKHGFTDTVRPSSNSLLVLYINRLVCNNGCRASSSVPTSEEEKEARGAPNQWRNYGRGGGGVLLGINDDLKYQQNKIEMKSRAYQTLDNEV